MEETKKRINELMFKPEQPDDDDDDDKDDVHPSDNNKKLTETSGQDDPNKVP